MPILLQSVEADLELLDEVTLNGAVGFAILTSDGDPTAHSLSVGRVVAAGGPEWQVNNVAVTTSAGSRAVAKIAIAASGADVTYTVTLDGETVATGTDTDGAALTWDLCWLIAGLAGGSGGISRNYYTTLTPARGAATTYSWTALLELADWSYPTLLPPNIDTTNGYIFDDAQYPAYLMQWQQAALPAFGGVSHCLQAPGIMRRVAVDDAGDLSEEWELDGFLAASLPDIEGGGYTFPEVCYTAAPGSGMLALVFGRTSSIVDVAYATGTGTPVTGWSDVQQIRADRTAPCACALPPTHDLYVVDLLSAALASDCIAYGQRLAWNGTSYDIGTETIVQSGDLTVTRGALVQHPGARLEYIFVDASGSVQVKASTNGGATWA